MSLRNGDISEKIMLEHNTAQTSSLRPLALTVSPIPVRSLGQTHVYVNGVNSDVILSMLNLFCAFAVEKMRVRRVLYE